MTTPDEHPEASGGLPSRLGAFEILALIGEGGNGRIYRARALADGNGCRAGEVVAIKELNLSAEDERHIERSRLMVQKLRDNPHPNIVRYISFFQVDDGGFSESCCLVMEYLEGKTLDHWIRQYPKGLPWPDVRRVFRGCFSALVHAARLGIVHRDLKPSNIFMLDDAARSAKLIDFEVAYHEDSAQSTAGADWLGTFDYMAPEFHPDLVPHPGFRGDERSDVFSLAVCLYEALTGKLPFPPIQRDGTTGFLERWHGENPPQVKFGQGIFRVLAHSQALLAKGLEYRRGERWGTFESMFEAFNRVAPRVIRHEGEEYILTEWVDKGGFGDVFKARRRSDGLSVAVKYLRKAAYSERFLREARLLHAVNHPNIVHAYGFLQLEGGSHFFLIMEFLEGMPAWSLRDRIREAPGGLGVEEVLLLFVGYADGLSALHSLGDGIIHRDIKPANLYAPPLNPKNAKILDLGIARDVSGTQTVGPVPGTFDYMAPEFGTSSDDRGSPASDLYSLGLCLYEALTGVPALERLPKEAKAASLEFYKRCRKAPTVDFSFAVFGECPGLRDLVQQAISLHPKDRFATAAEFRAALEECLKRWQQSSPARAQAVVAAQSAGSSKSGDREDAEPLTTATRVVKGQGGETLTVAPASIPGLPGKVLEELAKPARTGGVRPLLRRLAAGWRYAAAALAIALGLAAAAVGVARGPDWVHALRRGRLERELLAVIQLPQELDLADPSVASRQVHRLLSALQSSIDYKPRSADEPPLKDATNVMQRAQVLPSAFSNAFERLQTVAEKQAAGKIWSDVQRFFMASPEWQALQDYMAETVRVQEFLEARSDLLAQVSDPPDPRIPEQARALEALAELNLGQPPADWVEGGPLAAFLAQDRERLEGAVAFLTNSLVQALRRDADPTPLRDELDAWQAGHPVLTKMEETALGLARRRIVDKIGAWNMVAQEKQRIEALLRALEIAVAHLSNPGLRWSDPLDAHLGVLAEAGPVADETVASRVAAGRSALQARLQGWVGEYDGALAARRFDTAENVLNGLKGLALRHPGVVTLAPPAAEMDRRLAEAREKYDAAVAALGAEARKILDALRAIREALDSEGADFDALRGRWTEQKQAVEGWKPPPDKAVLQRYEEDRGVVLADLMNTEDAIEKAFVLMLERALMAHAERLAKAASGRGLSGEQSNSVAQARAWLQIHPEAEARLPEAWKAVVDNLSKVDAALRNATVADQLAALKDRGEHVEQAEQRFCEGMHAEAVRTWTDVAGWHAREKRQAEVPVDDWLALPRLLYESLAGLTARIEPLDSREARLKALAGFRASDPLAAVASVQGWRTAFVQRLDKALAVYVLELDNQTDQALKVELLGDVLTLEPGAKRQEACPVGALRVRATPPAGFALKDSLLQFNAVPGGARSISWTDLGDQPMLVRLGVRNRLSDVRVSIRRDGSDDWKEVLQEIQLLPGLFHVRFERDDYQPLPETPLNLVRGRAPDELAFPEPTAWKPSDALTVFESLRQEVEAGRFARFEALHLDLKQKGGVKSPARNELLQKWAAESAERMKAQERLLQQVARIEDRQAGEGGSLVERIRGLGDAAAAVRAARLTDPLAVEIRVGEVRAALAKRLRAQIGGKDAGRAKALAEVAQALDDPKAREALAEELALLQGDLEQARNLFVWSFRNASGLPVRITVPGREKPLEVNNGQTQPVEFPVGAPPSGKIEVQFEAGKPGYEPRRVSVALVAGGHDEFLLVEMTKRKVKLDFTPRPGETLLWKGSSDSKFQEARQPLALDPGPYELQWRRADYLPVTNKVDIPVQDDAFAIASPTEADWKPSTNIQRLQAAQERFAGGDLAGVWEALGEKPLGFADPARQAEYEMLRRACAAGVWRIADPTANPVVYRFRNEAAQKLRADAQRDPGPIARAYREFHPKSADPNAVYFPKDSFDAFLESVQDGRIEPEEYAMALYCHVQCWLRVLPLLIEHRGKVTAQYLSFVYLQASQLDRLLGVLPGAERAAHGQKVLSLLRAWSDAEAAGKAAAYAERFLRFPTRPGSAGDDGGFVDEVNSVLREYALQETPRQLVSYQAQIDLIKEVLRKVGHAP